MRATAKSKVPSKQQERHKGVATRKLAICDAVEAHSCVKLIAKFLLMSKTQQLI